MTQTRKLTPEEHQRAVKYARMTYAIIIFSFLSVVTIAVVTTMAMEKSNTGFHAITVKKPISFFDKTYLKQESPAPTKP